MQKKFVHFNTIIAFFCFMFVFFTGKVYAQEELHEQTMKVRLTQSVYIRPEKNSSEILAIGKSGEEFEGFVDGDWFKINYLEKDAYIAFAYLEEIDDLPPEEVIVDDEIEDKNEEEPVNEMFEGYLISSIFVRPEKNSQESLGILSKGSPVKGIFEGAWFKIEYEGQEAYLASSFVSEKVPEMEEEPQLMKGYTKSSLYVRPKKNSKEYLGILAKGVSVEGYVQGSWLVVKYNNQKAYIAKSLVEEGEAPQEEILKGTLSSDIFVRPYPSSSEKLGVLTKGSDVEGIVKGAWLEIDYYGDTAYIAKAFVKESPVKRIVQGYTSSSIYVRPNKNSRTYIGILGKNTPIIGFDEGAWIHINFEGRDGYIAKAYILKQKSLLEYSKERRNSFNKGEIINFDLYREEMLDLINEEREKHGIPRLTWGRHLVQGTETRVKELADISNIYIDGYSHVRPDGFSSYRTAFDYLNSYSDQKAISIGENLAMVSFVSEDVDEYMGMLGEDTARSVIRDEEKLADYFFNIWKSSPGHYQNMMNKNYKSIYTDIQFGKPKIWKGTDDIEYPEETIVGIQIFDTFEEDFHLNYGK